MKKLISTIAGLALALNLYAANITEEAIKLAKNNYHSLGIVNNVYNSKHVYGKEYCIVEIEFDNKIHSLCYTQHCMLDQDKENCTDVSLNLKRINAINGELEEFRYTIPTDEIAYKRYQAKKKGLRRVKQDKTKDIKKEFLDVLEKIINSFEE